MSTSRLWTVSPITRRIRGGDPRLAYTGALGDVLRALTLGETAAGSAQALAGDATGSASAALLLAVTKALEGAGVGNAAAVAALTVAGSGARRKMVPSRFDSLFPLALDGRNIVGHDGQTFPIVGDTAWSIAVQLTHSQIDTYLDDRQARGFNAILFELIEHYFSSQSPAYRNAQSSADPFTSMTDFATPNATYWATVDYVVNGAKARGMACFVCPAYLGFGGGSEGWMSEVTAESAGDLQAYGAFLAARYTQGNIVWVMGGDYAGDSTERAKQWNIVTGMRSVRTGDLITGHPARADENAYSKWNGYTGFSLNIIYVPTTNIADDRAATAWGQAMPFVLLEGGYEGEAGTAASIRMASYTSLLSGARGAFMGNNPIWGFGEPNSNGGAGAAAALSGSLNTTAAQQMAHFSALVHAYDIGLLEPKTDTSLVTTSLGTSGTTGRICPARASDGSFAMVWTPSSNFTVAMSALTPSSVRARWFNPSDGTYSTASGSPFSNTGTQAFTAPGERVLVLDAAP